MMEIRKILEQYGIDAAFVPKGNGHINDTYISADGNYILQRVNTDIFTSPEELMENVAFVTEFLREKIRQEGGDPSRETLEIVKTKDGRNYVAAEDGFFRVYKNVRDSITIEPEDATLPDLYEAGAGFGHFQKQLADFDVTRLHETIPHFHDTEKRFMDFERALLKDAAGRRDQAMTEIGFVLALASDASRVLEGIRSEKIPVCVTHNDTKINNLLFDKDTRKALCVIDLDTIMPGSRLYDFGDALRIGASTAAEDERNLTRVHLDTNAFRAFSRGYLSEMGGLLTKTEKQLLPFSVKLMCYECGMRFLTDFLEGDVYFKTDYPEHNLVRARTQFKMVQEAEQKEQEMYRIIQEILRENH